MRTRLNVTLIAALVCVTSVAVAPAFAQGASTQKPPAPAAKPGAAPKLPIGFRFFAGFDSTAMTASSTFKAVTGSSNVPGFGAGAEVLNLWRHVFVRFGFAAGSAEGKRGFVIDRVFVSNGVPLTIDMNHIELATGWRMYPGRQTHTALYFGVGADRGSLTQESPDPEPGDNGTASEVGYVALAGLEFAIQKRAKKPIIVGLEGSYRSVKGVLGDFGASKAYGEDDMGGVSIRGLVGIRFGR